MNTNLLIRKRKRTDLHRSALLFILAASLILMAGCTVDDPGYVITADNSKVQVVDSDNDIVTIDSSTGAITIIDYAHHEIHEGDAYTACKIFTLPGGGLANILLTTADTAKRSHFVFNLVSDDVMTVNLYEAPDYAGGVGVNSYNRDRGSANTAGMVLAHTAIDSGGGKGTLIWTFKGGANKTVTNSESDRFEFKLDRNKKYLLEAVGALNDSVTFLLDWYEHTDR